ncbi:MAG: HNH endonuclease, partial [Phycisphaerales bacterium]
QLRDKWTGTTRLLQCTNHPACPGEIEEVLPTDTCRNFKPKWWGRPRKKAAKHVRRAAACQNRRGSKRIPLGNGRFALVEAADLERVSKYRWYASRHGRTTYAITLDCGTEVAMHRMIMRPRRGYVVHHLDHNGLNNRRDNLLVCTPRQHMAARAPNGGASRFIGVYRRGDKWEARIRCRGKVYYLGYFDDEIAAAKARDRKAYELHGKFAYLNFPEDYRL